MTAQAAHITAAIAAQNALKAALIDDPENMLDETFAAETRAMNAMSLLTDDEIRIVTAATQG